ncbi:RAB11-binding protein RELCH isoform X3 [Muntiacus reevesi]|uniref:RAB11-binding protein RELCH isoform X3 n=1 Tax=Muntiacus reevesi TaxID=9886 RepID=UPI003306A3F1
MAAMAPGGGGGGVNPFLSDSDEDEDEVSATDERRAGLRLGAGGGLDPGSADSLSPQDPMALGSSARAGLPGEAAALGGPGETPARLSIDAIAAQLLRDQYLLTALELHTELLESGRELPRLRDYFSNPGNFERQSGTPPGTGAPGVPGATGLGGAGGREPSTTSGGGQLNRAGSISTLDSLDFARYSDDGNRETDERVAVLEFELRKAKETIQALRANLTKAAEHEVPLQERKNYKSSPEIQEPIKPLEKRALNFLVNEFLLKNNYKLTSITFSDENDDQDFELWDDVGLNIPKPPDLLQLYRDFGNHQVTGKDFVDVASGVEEDELEALTPVLGSLPSTLEIPHAVENSLLVQKLEDKISLLNSEKWSLMEQIRRLESEMDFLKNEHFASPVVCDSVQPSLDQSPHKDSEDSGKNSVINSLDKGEKKDVHLSKSDEVDSTVPKENFPHSFPRREREGIPSSPSSKNTVHFDKPNRKLSPAFHQALLSFCRMSADSRLGSEVSRIADSETSVMLMLGRCLPHIVPNVLLAKREELIPLILCTACLHPEPKERDQLLHILFNLIKRPDDEQRQMILTGCVAFARHVGPTRVEAELLPQCWEQINHKYPERRLLVAESCGALAPYLPKEIRSSLVLSMLQQMLMEDKADLVREAVIKSLGIIMGYIDDPDKYQQGFELLLSALGDPSERVVSATHQVFLPAYAAWTTELGNLQSHLLPTLLNKIEKLLREGDRGLDEHKLHMYLSALQSLIPSLFALVLQNAPFSSKAKLHGDVPQIEVTRFPRPVSPLQDVSTIIGSREQLALLLQLYDYQLEHEGTTGWESLLWVVNQLLPQLIEIVGKINVTSTACVHEFSRFFWRLCRTFGKIFTNTKVKPQFQEILRLSEENIDSSAGNGVLTKATVPIYATGVLTCYIQEEDRKLLIGFLEDVMTLLSLSHAPLDSLKASFVELGANPAYHELLLTVLWYGVVHTSALVRCTAARMFEVILTSMIKECEQKVENKTVQEPQGSMSIAASLVSEDTKTKFLNKMGQLTTSGAMLANVFQRKK